MAKQPAPKKAYETWTVLPHGPLQRLDDRVWRIEADLPNMPLRRQMIVVRLADGSSLVHNAIALEEPVMAEIEAWGRPSLIVVPNGWHRLDCVVYKKRYPGARIVCPRGSQKKVSEVVAVDHTYDDLRIDDPDVSLRHLEGVKEVEGVLSVRGEKGATLVFNDVLFNLPHAGGVTGWIFRLMGSTGGPKVPGMSRFMVVKDKGAFKSDLLRLAETPNLARIVPGHGAPVDVDAAGTLRRIAAAL